MKDLICNINDNWVLYNDSQLFKMDNPVIYSYTCVFWNAALILKIHRRL